MPRFYTNKPENYPGVKKSAIPHGYKVDGNDRYTIVNWKKLGLESAPKEWGVRAFNPKAGRFTDEFYDNFDDAYSRVVGKGKK